MDDPGTLVLAVAFALAFLLGVLAGWKVRPLALGCLGVGVLLIVAVGILIFLYSQIAFFRDDEWAPVGFVVLLALILIGWTITVMGWVAGWAVQAYREPRSHSSRAPNDNLP